MKTTQIRILLVEDNPADARLVEEHLRDALREAFVIHRADRLSKCIDALTDEIDVLLLDLGLPDSVGLDTFKRVNQHAPRMPVVILTGFRDEEAGIEAVRAGAQDYLVKGQADGDALARALRYAIERRSMENRIRQMNASLELRVAERTSELRSLIHELEAFNYSASHDLKAPLRAIVTLNDFFQTECAAGLSENCLEYLERIRQAGKRMGELIEDLLKMSQVTRLDITRQPLDLSAITRAAIMDLQATSPDRVVDIRIVPDVQGYGDARLLRIVLENLVGNAWKYTSHRPSCRIEFGVEQSSDGDLAYYVRDNGIGFDPAAAGKLFEPFQRLESQGQFEGTGIGLATVKRIIERHGGTVWAEGVPGKGAKFSFTLPKNRHGAPPKKSVTLEDLRV